MGLSYFALVHIMQGLVKIFDRVDLADLVDREPSLQMQINEFGDELRKVRLVPTLPPFFSVFGCIFKLTLDGVASPSMTERKVLLPKKNGSVSMSILTPGRGTPTETAEPPYPIQSTAA